MRTVICLGVTFVTIALLGSTVFAGEPSVPAETPKPGLMSWLGGDDVVQAAKDLRVAAETFERFGRSLEGITSGIAEALAALGASHAKMSEGFDPFGYKAAFQTIQQQHETIEALHKAEVKRLDRERKKLERELKELRRQLQAAEIQKSVIVQPSEAK